MKTHHPNRRRHWLVLALVFGFPVYALLNSGPGRSCSPVLPGLIPTASAALPNKVIPAPEWELKTAAGETISSRDFAGQTVVLNFWGTWCPPCREEIPALVQLQKDFADRGLTVIGIAAEPNPAGLDAFAKKAGINYPVALATKDVLAAYGGIDVFPTTFFIDREGKIRKFVQGSMDYAGFAQAAESILD
jgi:peroxiredoxin